MDYLKNKKSKLIPTNRVFQKLMTAESLAISLHFFGFDSLEDGKDRVDLVSRGNHFFENIRNATVIEVQLIADLIGEARHERFEDVANEVDEVDGDVADGAAESGIGLQDSPGLGILEILVTQSGDLHGPLQTGLQVRLVHGFVVSMND